MVPPALIARLRRLRWRSHLVTLLMVLGVLAGAHLWQTRHVPAGVVPDVQLTMVSGETLRLSAWRARHPGQPVVLHVWAQWCPVCRAEEGSITQLQKDLPVLTVAMQSGTAAQVLKVLEQRHLPWETAVDADGQLARALGVRAVPALLVMDADGQIGAASVGYTSEMGMRLRWWWVKWTRRS